MKNLMWMWALGLLPGLFGTAATAGSAITSNPLMLMMLMGGRINMQTLLLMSMMQGQTGGSTFLSSTSGTSNLLPLLLMSQSSGRRSYRRRKPQAIRVYNSRRY